MTGSKLYTEDRLVNVPLTEREPLGQYGGFRTITVGHKQGFVRVTIDVEELSRQIARRALQGKSGRATALHGLIKGVLFKNTVTKHYPNKAAV